MGRFKDFSLIDTREDTNIALTESLMELPEDTFYWTDGRNPTETRPYACMRDGKVVVSLESDVEKNIGMRAIELNLPKRARLNQVASSDVSSVFRFRRINYEVFHIVNRIMSKEYL